MNESERAAVFAYPSPAKSGSASDPYSKAMLNTRVLLAITEVGGAEKTLENLARKVAQQCEGACIVNGYVKPGSSRIVSQSCGTVRNEQIEYTIVYECMVCNPAEGAELEAVVQTITKAGIHAHVLDADGNTPITVFVAREHHHGDEHFAEVSERARITVRSIGSRFELNDPYVSVIASLVSDTSPRAGKSKAKASDESV
jgi:DNA-directed RNA polymerase subunit E'/Rpb7